MPSSAGKILVVVVVMSDGSWCHFLVDSFLNSYVYQDMTQSTPTQELVAKDLHGYEWRFKHIFRGNGISFSGLEQSDLK